MDKYQRVVILVRDISCIVAGLVGLWAQTFKAEEPSGLLVPAFVGLLLGPAGAALWAQRSSGGPATIEPSSSEQPPQEPQPSSPQP